MCYDLYAVIPNPITDPCRWGTGDYGPNSIIGRRDRDDWSDNEVPQILK